MSFEIYSISNTPLMISTDALLMTLTDTLFGIIIVTFSEILTDTLFMTLTVTLFMIFPETFLVMLTVIL